MSEKAANSCLLLFCEKNGGNKIPEMDTEYRYWMNKDVHYGGKILFQGFLQTSQEKLLDFYFVS